ncbi:MAG TPA: NAD-dependent epimerase/dehydratase family protein [Bryobacteraceae bacterium]|nr:NAD-dependent epimerase/dehydratase family protein [Bryobacteraceae bacterium]
MSTTTNGSKRQEPAKRKVLVIGGTLFIGRALVKELLKAGHEVSILHRKPRHNLGKKVSSIVADRNDSESLKRALSGKNFDVVYDNVYDWERGTTAAQVEATARACGANLHRYVYMSSVAAYGDGLNHHEGDALAPDDHPDAYVRNKAMSERTLFRMHQRNGFPVVTLRPPFIYGPGNPFYREAFFWDRLREARPIILPGDGRRLMQFVMIQDLVGACLKVLDVPDVEGHAFNIANPRPLTQVEAVEAFARAAGKEPTFVRWPRERILRAGGHPMGPKLYFGMYFDMPAITVVVNKAQRVLKFKPVDFGVGLKETYRWYLRHHEFPKPDYTFEDALIEAAPASAYSAPAD